MRRQARVDGRSARIEIEGTRLRYQSDDGAQVESEFSLERTGPGKFSVLLGGRSYQVTRGSGQEVLVNGHTFVAEVFDPRDFRPEQEAAPNHGRQEVAALMPGKVIRVLVAPGDAVQEGQGLVVVEAMKMQNEMKSPKAGRVAEVRARAEATVGAGEVLVVVE